jgi:hypothetical protein
MFVVVYCARGIVGPSLGGLSMYCWTPNGLLVFLSIARCSWQPVGCCAGAAPPREGLVSTPHMSIGAMRLK